jgi:NAD(P)-dependent dehydrogenase (short-subunit alcohol dehydrogenase family)
MIMTTDEPGSRPPRQILVTGGTRGIGLNIALEFAEPGNTLFLNYAHDAARAGSAADRIRQAGATCHLLQADLGSAEGCRALARGVETAESGKAAALDLVVHGAVDALAGPLLTLEDEALVQALMVNGLSLHRITRALLPQLQRGSSIVFVTSTGGKRVVPNYAAIGMGKALSECAMRYLAGELAPLGIRINAISPAVTDTDALRQVFGDQAERVVQQAADANPSGRGVEAADYTRLVRWLASPDAAFIQGQVIAVNGGSGLTA